jgi:hypothetical protein
MNLAPGCHKEPSKPPEKPVPSQRFGSGYKAHHGGNDDSSYCQNKPVATSHRVETKTPGKALLILREPPPEDLQSLLIRQQRIQADWAERSVNIVDRGTRPIGEASRMKGSPAWFVLHREIGRGDESKQIWHCRFSGPGPAEGTQSMSV